VFNGHERNPGGGAAVKGTFRSSSILASEDDSEESDILNGKIKHENAS
jgi:hypothetical protein